jgi:hypothetical protein
MHCREFSRPFFGDELTSALGDSRMSILDSGFRWLSVPNPEPRGRNGVQSLAT